MNHRMPAASLLIALFLAAPGLLAQGKRKVIIDQDARGPATTDLQSVLLLIQSPETDVLGITVVSGDQWRDEEVAHTLRLVETIGRTDIPVFPGAVFPLLNSKEEIRRWETLYGKVSYQGAWNEHPVGYNTGVWNRGRYYGPFEMPSLPEGAPSTKPAAEDAAHFLVRIVRQFPHEVTIYAGGPLTNLALAIAIDPEFAALAKELMVMGGSISPVGDRKVNLTTPRREFNFWWDPEATRIVLRARWPKITVTTVDISIKTWMSKAIIERIGQSQTPAAQYIAKWADEEYMWDELAAAAWLDPSIITKQEQLYMDINLDHGAGYGDTLVWLPGSQPGLGEQLVHIQVDLDKEKFYQFCLDLLTRPTPVAKTGH